MGGTGLAHGGGEVVGQGPVPHPERAGQRLGRPPVHAGDRHLVHLVGAHAGGLQPCLPRLGPQRDVAGLAEALLPHPGPAVAGGAPPVEELVADRGPPEILGHHRCARPVVPDQDGGGTVPAGHLVGRGGEAVAQVGQDDQGGSRAGGRQGGAQGPGPRPQRTAEVEGGHPGRLAQGGVDGGGVGLVQVGRGGGGEPDGVGSGGGDGPEGQAGRLHPHGGGVLVVRGHRAGPPASARPEQLGHRRALQAPVGDVAGDADDASHLCAVPFDSGGR